MKKILSTLIISTMLLTSGCSWFKMDEMEYYNLFIDYINQLTDDLDYAMDDYLTSVPEEIDPEQDIDFYATYYSTAIANLEQAQIDLASEEREIADEERQSEIESYGYNFFASLANFYAGYYEAAEFYSDQGHKTDVDGAYEIDAVMIDNYYIAAAAQMELINLISTYQIDVMGDLDEDTENPLEKISVSMTLIYRAADELVYELSYWDFEDPNIDGIEELYDKLLEIHAEEEYEVSQLYDDEYSDVFDAFQTSYLGILTSFEEEVAKIIEDGKAGVITEETGSDYDVAFDYYDQLIEVHNAIVDMLWFDF